MKREIRRREADGSYAVWERHEDEGSSVWRIIGVFSDSASALACRIDGAVWPWHKRVAA